jgi:hypothetical protein
MSNRDNFRRLRVGCTNSNLPPNRTDSAPDREFVHPTRTALTTMRIRPPARHQLAMPAQKRRRRNTERPPGSPRQRTAECSQQDPMARAKLRTRDLALQHPQLVTQNKDFDLLLPLAPAAQNQQLKQAPQRPVSERENDPLANPAPRRLTLQAEPFTTDAYHAMTPRRRRSNRVSGTHTPRSDSAAPARTRARSARTSSLRGRAAQRSMSSPTGRSGPTRSSPS